MKRLLTIVGSFLIGAAAMLLIVYLAAPKLMIHEVESPLGFEQTVATIINNVRDDGQVVPKVYDFRKSLIEHTGTDVGEASVIEICYPEYAAELLAVADNKFVTPFMPCAVGVYTKSDGTTYVASMNVGLMSKILGSEVAGPMGKVAVKDAQILAFLHQ